MNISNKMTGLVFNIQKFSLNDGPGIRDMVFLKGCPLRCRWCSNPESQRLDPEILFRPDKCIGTDVCGLCVSACPDGAFHKGMSTVNNEDKKESPDNRQKPSPVTMDWSRCTHCGECTKDCPGDALEYVGHEMSVDDVVAVVEKDGGFHVRSGGGVTVSGGEPLMQADFVGALLETCKDRLINTAVETTGHGSWEQLKKTVEHANQVFYDIKCADPELHNAYTGIPNTTILKNLHRLSDEMPNLKIIVRTPVIPRFNDTEKAIFDIRKIIEPISSVKAYQLLPFHRLGIAKYEYQGKACEYMDIQPPGDDKMTQLKKYEYTHF